MRRIEVLGPGCPNCQRLEANARQAVAMAAVEAEIVKVEDYRSIIAYGVMSTPALVIDGRVMSAGRIPSPGDIAEWLSRSPRGVPGATPSRRPSRMLNRASTPGRVWRSGLSGQALSPRP